MKTIFKLFLLNGFLLLLNYCVPIQELDESYNQMEQTYVTDTNHSFSPRINSPVTGVHQINIIRDYYRAPDGTIYKRDDFYRDKYGKVYLNGLVFGQDNIYDHPGVIGQFRTSFLPMPNLGFLPPVDFDDPLQTNMNKNGNSTPTKRSGSNSNTYPGSFKQSPRK